MGGEHTQHGDAGRRDDSHLGQYGAVGARFHHDTQNGMQFENFELFLSEIF